MKSRIKSFAADYAFHLVWSVLILAYATTVSVKAFQQDMPMSSKMSTAVAWALNWAVMVAVLAWSAHKRDTDRLMYTRRCAMSTFWTGVAAIPLQFLFWRAEWPVPTEIASNVIVVMTGTGFTLWIIYRVERRALRPWKAPAVKSNEQDSRPAPTPQADRNLKHQEYINERHE